MGQDHNRKKYENRDTKMSDIFFLKKRETILVNSIK